MTTPSIPLLGDIALSAVQRIEHAVGGGFTSLPVPGLGGELQQRLARPSHRMRISGTLFGESAAADLETLQLAAGEGAELTFAADIATALELEKVVITDFRAVADAGFPGRFHYEVSLAESPPLPPPVEPGGFGFGGLDDFGLGDLGFDTDILGDLEDLAGEIAGAIDSAMAIVDAVTALASLDGLDLGNFLAPLEDVVGGVSGIADEFGAATRGLSDLLGGEGP